MKITYSKDGNKETFEVRPGFELKLELTKTNSGTWVGEAKDGYFTEDGICNWLYEVNHFEVS